MRQKERSFLCILALAAAAAATAGGAGCAAAQDSQPYSLLGPLRERDMTPYHITRLEMMPAESSEALALGWTFEADLTHSNEFAHSTAVLHYLATRGGRQPFTGRDASAILAAPGDTFYFDGEIGLFAPTVHYQLDQHLGFFLTLPVYYYTGGVFDGLIETYHSTLGFPEGGRPLVTRNEFAIVYRVGREQVVTLGAPESGPSDPILGVRYRLLPAGGPWDLVVEGALKPAVHDQGSLSTGGTDLGLQLAVHRRFRRQAVYLDLSAVRVGGPYADPRVDRRLIPSGVLAWELGLGHRSSFVIQYYLGASVFQRSTTPDLVQTKNEIVGGFRFQHGPADWYFDVIENIFHLEDTPDVGAQLGVRWRFGARLRSAA